MTPLEIFLAIAATYAQPPETLVEDHQRLTYSRSDVPAVPRTTIPHQLLGRVVQDHFDHGGCYGYTAESDGYWNAGGYFDEFLDDVYDTFGEALPHNSGPLQIFQYPFTGYTGFSSRRAIGVCNASGADKIVIIERRTSDCTWQGIPINLPGYDGALGEWQSLFYDSDSGSWSRQYRVRVFRVDDPPDFYNTEMTYVGMTW